MKNIIIILIGFMMFSSCEEYLNEPNPNAPDLLDNANSLEDSDRVLNGLYNTLFNQYVMSIQEDNVWSDIGALKRRIELSTNAQGHTDFYAQDVNGQTARIAQRWSALYRGIFVSNQVLAVLDKVKGNLSAGELEEWNIQRSQALFFRGLYHSYAHSVFNNGKIIIRDKYETDLAKRNKDVSSSADVIAFFRKDLADAIEFLPESWGASDLGRVTKGAATMILANSYLYEATEGKPLLNPDMALIEKAKDLYEDLINDYGYALETRVDTRTLEGSYMFTHNGEFNKESIFEIPYTNEFGLELDQYNEKSPHSRLAKETAHFNFFGNDFLQPASWLFIAYENEVINPANAMNIVERGNNTPGFRRESLRASNMLFMNNDLDTPVYNVPNVLQSSFGNGDNPIGLRSNSLIFTAFKKYTNHDMGVKTEEDAGVDGNAFLSGKNVIINRLSEVYLNLAECYIYMGRLGDAISSINEIRNRWALEPLDLAARVDDPSMAYDDASLMDRLMYFEKPLELAAEGHAIRVIDLRRWGVAKERFTSLSSQYYQGVTFPNAKHSSDPPITPDLARGANVGTNLLGDVIEVIDGTGNNVFKEFENAATNYVHDYSDVSVGKNGYLPIPTEETNFNEEL
ncbi:RagB/SusD family nutrient uptake outer membrane protein [Algibacter sp. AS12]|uniref:RagB/SusD family nutrient uptake outer membrane protein n=1 Tax=Algibacter sp. AS12 TaxID=3135773 RepID=UPI00398A6059